MLHSHPRCQQVYSLPGLGLISDAPLSACCGWPWAWDRGLPCGGASGSRQGHLALMGPSLELLRLGVAAGEVSIELFLSEIMTLLRLAATPIGTRWHAGAAALEACCI